jgi:membrane fusion protein (multidrug efflux system)
MTDRAASFPHQQQKRARRRRLAPSVAAAVVALAVVFWGLGYLVETFTRESTDDAFLEGHVVAIAPKVAGIVNEVHVAHFQNVKKGDPLFEIEPRDYEVALEQKRSTLASAQAGQHLIESGFQLMRTRVETAEASQRQAEADAAASRATLERAEADFNRFQGLIKQNVVSQQDYDATHAAAVWAKAAVQSADQKIITEQSHVKEARDELEAARSAFDQARAKVATAEADIKAAELNVSYTKVVAPEDGCIARKNIEPGSYIQAGQQVLAIVPNHYWVVANFKETQLAKIRVGQDAEVEIDAVPGRTFRGRIESMLPGSGSRFSLLPPENAVGNFVKVVQRVPVKIAFVDALPPDRILGPGMSVRPAVLTSHFALPEWARWVIALLFALIAGALTHWFLREQVAAVE